MNKCHAEIYDQLTELICSQCAHVSDAGVARGCCMIIQKAYIYIYNTFSYSMCIYVILDPTHACNVSVNKLVLYTHMHAICISINSRIRTDTHVVILAIATIFLSQVAL